MAQKPLQDTISAIEKDIKFLYDNTMRTNIDYSLQEQDTTLRWVDDRKIFQKTIELPMFPYDPINQQMIDDEWPYNPVYPLYPGAPREITEFYNRMYGFRVSMYSTDPQYTTPTYTNRIYQWAGFRDQFYTIHQAQLIDWEFSTPSTDYPISGAGQIGQPSGNNRSHLNVTLSGAGIYISVMLFIENNAGIWNRLLGNGGFLTLRYVKK